MQRWCVLFMVALCAGGAGMAAAQTLGGKLMSFDELRTCLHEQDGLKTRREALETRRAGLDAERAAIDKDIESSSADSQTLQAYNAKVKDFNARRQALVERINTLAQRQRAVADGSHPASDEERDTWPAERQRLLAEDAAQQQEMKTLQAAKEALGDITARLAAQQKQAQAWNATNRQWLADNIAYEDDRTDWRSRCGNRRYREDDEKLIRRQ